jgi:hypothetical protein
LDTDEDDDEVHWTSFQVIYCGGGGRWASTFTWLSLLSREY